MQGSANSKKAAQKVEYRGTLDGACKYMTLRMCDAALYAYDHGMDTRMRVSHV